LFPPHKSALLRHVALYNSTLFCIAYVQIYCIGRYTTVCISTSAAEPIDLDLRRPQCVNLQCLYFCKLRELITNKFTARGAVNCICSTCSSILL